ncbi:MAG: GNAT family N-acetyltransferase [Sphaerochaetaceae bacterium]
MATIRTMRTDDYKDVYTLWLHTKGMGLNTSDDSLQGITRYLERNPHTCFVAEENRNIIGVIIAGHDGRRGFIYHTAVAATARRKGIGTALVEASLQALGAEGIVKVALVVFAGNATGNAFWEARGFSVRNDLLYRNKSLVSLERIDT